MMDVRLLRGCAVVVALALVLAAASTAQQTDATAVAFSAPVATVEIDLGKLKGELRRLSWAPDGTQFCVQTAEADARLGSKIRHYVVSADGKAPGSVGEEPAWSAAYWAWKSAQSAPGNPGWKIQVEQQTKRVSATATPMAGNAARGEITTGMGISVEEATGAAQQTQNASVFTLRLNGEVVGEFVNSPAVPGLTFGWSRRPGLVAFVHASGRVIVMDERGRKQEVAGSRAAILPAWSHDGSRLVWLEKIGRKKYVMQTTTMTSRVP